MPGQSGAKAMKKLVSSRAYIEGMDTRDADFYHSPIIYSLHIRMDISGNLDSDLIYNLRRPFGVGYFLKNNFSVGRRFYDQRPEIID